MCFYLKSDDYTIPQVILQETSVAHNYQIHTFGINNVGSVTPKLVSY